MGRIEQAMQVNDEIAHMSVVHGALRGALPGPVGAGIIGEDTDDIEVGRIAEIRPFQILKFAAEHKMEKLMGHAHYLGSLLRRRSLARAGQDGSASWVTRRKSAS